MATINFLPVCSHCHQVLWGETIEVIDHKDFKDSFILKALQQEVYPHMCPYCKEIFTTIEIPGGLPYICKSL